MHENSVHAAGITGYGNCNTWSDSKAADQADKRLQFLTGCNSRQNTGSIPLTWKARLDSPCRTTGGGSICRIPLDLASSQLQYPEGKDLLPTLHLPFCSERKPCLGQRLQDWLLSLTKRPKADTHIHTQLLHFCKAP